MRVIQSIALISATVAVADARRRRGRRTYYEAEVGPYPGSTLPAPTGSTFKIKDAGNGALKIFYNIQNFKRNSLVKFHIHSGITCDDKSLVGGHFWSPFAEADPQNDANGFAGTTNDQGRWSGSVVSNIGYSLADVASHTLVVHDGTLPGAPRIGCGIINREAKASTTGPWTAYPGYTGPQPMPTGAVSVYENKQGTATVSFVLGNMLGSGGGLHIHAGTSCDDANDVAGGYTGVKGHYYNVDELGTNDPWSTSWATKAAGTSSVAEGAFNVDTQLDIEDLANKVVIIHDSQSNSKAWCAELGNFKPAKTATASDWTVFTGYAGPQPQPTGSVSVTANSAGDATIAFNLDNMETGADSRQGLHIHAGTSCDDANDAAGGYTGVKGHYYNVDELGTNDPWSTSWDISPATGSFIVDTGLDFSDLADKVFIIHDSASNAKSWCSKAGGINLKGKIVSTEWEIFPGYAGPQTQPAGSITVSEVAGGAKLDYSLSGLLGSGGGLHIHAGTSCADANDEAGGYTGKKGHYYDVAALGQNDPWSTSWSANPNAAAGSFKVDTQLPFSDLANKVIIIHDGASNAKSWCAELDGADPEDAEESSSSEESSSTEESSEEDGRKRKGRKGL